MAVGNTFGATALSSYGGFWIAFAIVLTPGGFEIASSIETAAGPKAFLDSFGFFLMVGSVPFQQDCNAWMITDCSLSGLVHLHLPARALHPEVHCGFLLAVLHLGSGIPVSRYRLSSTKCGHGTKPKSYQGRWLVWNDGCLPCVVQRIGWYRGYFQQV